MTRVARWVLAQIKKKSFPFFPCWEKGNWEHHIIGTRMWQDCGQQGNKCGLRATKNQLTVAYTWENEYIGLEEEFLFYRKIKFWSCWCSMSRLEECSFIWFIKDGSALFFWGFVCLFVFEISKVISSILDTLSLSAPWETQEEKQSQQLDMWFSDERDEDKSEQSPYIIVIKSMVRCLREK